MVGQKSTVERRCAAQAAMSRSGTTRSRRLGLGRWRHCLLIGVLLLSHALLGTSAWAFDPASGPEAPDPFADVLPAALAPAEEAAMGMSAVQLDVALDPALSQISGEMTVDWHNAATTPLDEVWFRLFPNASYYGEGNLAVTEVTVDGASVTPELALEETALRVPLPAPVAPGDAAEIAMAFTTTIPADSTGSYGIFTHDTGNGSWVLADWHPLLAVYEEDDGWVLPLVTSFGDPTYAPSAMYDVQVSAPAELEVIASGVLVEKATDDAQVTRHFIAGPARDFVVVADDDHVTSETTVDGTLIRLWNAPDLSDDTAQTTLDRAAEALRYYNAWLGAYPAREVDLVEVDPAGALGIAWSGLLFLDGPALLDTYGDYDPEGLASIVGHEVAHLWWGILIGGDSNKHPFIQEGLATVSSLLYLDETLGPDAATGELEAWVIAPSRRLLSAGDAVVDLPIEEGQDERIRSDAAYGKGSLGFLAIREQIGAEAFAAALQAIATDERWGEVTPQDLRAAFEEASDQDLGNLWRHWFEEAAMTGEEIDRLSTIFE